MEFPPEVSGSETPRMSELGRLTGIFWEPTPVFRDLAAHPRWWSPIVLITALSVIFVYLFSRLVGWGVFLDRELSNNPRTANLPPEQLEGIIAQQTKFLGIFSYAAAVLGTVVIVLIVAAILLFVFRAIGASDLSFKQSLSVTSYSWLPVALSGLLSIVVLYLSNPMDFDLKNPLPFNLGWFLDSSSTAGWLRQLASSLDLFTFWIMALLALGFSVVVKKMRFGKAFAAILSLWLVTVVIKVGWTLIFS